MNEQTHVRNHQYWELPIITINNALIILICGFVALLVGCDSRSQPTTIDMGQFEIPAANWKTQVIKVEKITSEPVQVQLKLQHYTGPPVDILVLDKANYNLWESDGKWIHTPQDPSRPMIRTVLGDQFQAIAPSLKISSFQTSLETDWISVGSQNVLYLVCCSRDRNRISNISATLKVREAE